jgi:CDP-diacylglycerol---glycerol-3-phosphate 3-phosphatidyltransferase
MNLAMVLTGGRIALAPVFFLLYQLAARGPTWLLPLVWAVVLLIELTDLLDGFVARRYGQESELGKVLDPCADSIARITYFLCLSGSGILPLWIMLVIVYRDIAVAYIRVMLSSRGFLMPARLSGKLKAWIYAIAGIAGISWFSLQKLGSDLARDKTLQGILLGLFVASAAVAAWSLADYFSFFRKNSGKTS